LKIQGTGRAREADLPGGAAAVKILQQSIIQRRDLDPQLSGFQLAA
jgi:hypothetical protein